MRFYCPNAVIAVIGAEGAANILFSREIAQSDNSEQSRAEKRRIPHFFIQGMLFLLSKMNIDLG